MIRQLAIFLLAMTLWAPPVAAASVDRKAATTSINALRLSNGQGKIRYSKKLEKTAQAHSADMARNSFFSHKGSDGSGVGDRLHRDGYRWCRAAENIASGQNTLSQAMYAWTKSPGHLKNMLHRDITEFALVRTPGKLWVMVLARPGC